MKALEGTKTQTRRLSTRTYTPGRTYGVRCSRFDKSQAHIQIMNSKIQRLDDISPEDVKAEGFATLEEFKEAWTKINGSWNPDQNVTAYEFKIIKKEPLKKQEGPA